MGAPADPLRIVREQHIRLGDVTWARTPHLWLFDHPEWSHRPGVLRGGGVLLLLGLVALNSWVSVPDWGNLAFAVSAVGIGVMIVLARRRRRRRLCEHWRQRAGELAHFYLVLDPNGVQVGLHDGFRDHCEWSRCRLIPGGPAGPFSLSADAISIPARVFSNLSAAEILQVRYWVGHAHGEPDLCPRCRYDLRVSPGPRCPECGATVRMADPGTPAASGGSNSVH